ncbi:MAG: hypothetical protein R2941_22245 [Desulfobacterales bacterium]
MGAGHPNREVFLSYREMVQMVCCQGGTETVWADMPSGSENGDAVLFEREGAW